MWKVPKSGYVELKWGKNERPHHEWKMGLANDPIGILRNTRSKVMVGGAVSKI